MSTFNVTTDIRPKAMRNAKQEDKQDSEQQNLRIIKARTLYTKVFGAIDSAEGPLGPLGLPLRADNIIENNPSSASTGGTNTTNSVNNDDKDQNRIPKVEEQSPGEESAEDSGMNFWALVERAAELVEKARGEGKFDEWSVSEEAINYSMEMPEGTPLSDPAVIEAIFADADFVSMCEKAKDSFQEEIRGRVCRVVY